jgi:hypothetical protein
MGRKSHSEITKKPKRQALRRLRLRLRLRLRHHRLPSELQLLI